MALVDITIDRKTWGGNVAEQGKREYSVDYLVRFSTPYEGPNRAVAVLGLVAGSPYRVAGDFDPNAVLKSLTPRCEGDSTLFRVTAKWGPRDPDQEQPNPLKRPVKWSYQNHADREIVYKDVKGKAILNSSGEYFDPPVERDDHRPVLVATWNLPTFDPLWCGKFKDKVNKDTFRRVFKPGTLKLTGITAEGPNFENGIEFWQHRAEMHEKPEKWDPIELLDQSRNRLVDGKLVPLHPFDSNGNELKGERLQEPVPIERIDAKNSRRLENPTPETVKYIKAKIYQTINFSELGIG